MRWTIEEIDKILDFEPQAVTQLLRKYSKLIDFYATSGGTSNYEVEARYCMEDHLLNAIQQFDKSKVK